MGKGDGSPIHLAGSLPNYVAGWAGDMAVFRRNLAAIQQTAHTLILAVTGEEGATGDTETRAA